MRRLLIGLLATGVVAGPAQADVPAKYLPPVKREPCSTAPCLVKRVTLKPGQTVTFTTRTRHRVDRDQQLAGYVNGGTRDRLWVIEGIVCGAYYYGGGLVLKATMPRCKSVQRSRIRLRLTNVRETAVRVKLTLTDRPYRQPEAPTPDEPDLPVDPDAWGRDRTDLCWGVDPAQPGCELRP